MDVKKAYDSWSKQYDTNTNLTRDLEAQALRTVLSEIKFDNCLEIGCGTGKNTEWLITKAKKIIAVDLSNEMLAIARKKIKSDQVEFIQADIIQDWNFVSSGYDLITFSLVLEHIEDLEAIFNKITSVINDRGHVYIGELHPFKQYTGSKARFETDEGILQVVPCFDHHISDFISAAKKFGFEISELKEFFDNHDKPAMPRILTLLLKKNNF
jgi:ubiquinone/menaquinone biosynthesis C-methylase UbiE